MVKSIVSKYNDLRIGQKLILIFLMISVVPIVILQVYHFASVSNNMRNQVDEIIYNDLIQISERTNLSIENYTNLLYQIYVDEEIIDEISVLTNGTETRKARARSQIREKLQQYTSILEGVRAVCIVCQNGEAVTYDFATDSSVWNIWNRFSDMRISPPYMDAEGEAGMVITPTMKFEDNGVNKYYFHISKRMYNFDQLEKGSIATAILTVDVDVLNSICNARDAHGTGINFIVSEDNKIISYPGNESIAVDTGDNLEEFVRNSGYLTSSKGIGVNTYNDASTGWTFVNAYDMDEMMHELRHTEVIILVLSAVIILLVVTIIVYTTRNFNKSVGTIVEGMKTVQSGNLDKKITIISKDEFGTIADNFNLMTGRVKGLLEEVSSAKDRQRIAEIKALEAQINPHFLYNTLDSINWMAIEHGENDISKALSNLGLILRHSVSKTDEQTDIRTECDFLRRYLDLQEMRFEGAFRYELNIIPDVEHLYIHKLMIQPFVENAIIHGFEELEEGGILSINIDLSEDKEFLQISIADNGKGFPEDILKKMNDRMAIISDTENGNMGLGLHNAFSRLVMYYGEKAHWTINSVEGIGTEITLYIPYNECMEVGDEYSNS